MVPWLVRLLVQQRQRGRGIAANQQQRVVRIQAGQCVAKMTRQLPGGQLTIQPADQAGIEPVVERDKALERLTGHVQQQRPVVAQMGDFRLLHQGPVDAFVLGQGVALFRGKRGLFDDRSQGMALGTGASPVLFAVFEAAHGCSPERIAVRSRMALCRHSTQIPAGGASREMSCGG